jgi:hypothetical protein
LPLEGVQPDIDYAVLLTTPGGLVRTVLGDIVRFTSVQPPRLVVAGRTALQLNAFAEQVTEKQLTDSLVTVCTRHDWTITDFHVAPLLTKGAMTSQIRGGHEWWIELKPRMVETPLGPPIAEEIDVELQRLNSHYATRRRSGAIDQPSVRLVMPGVFEHWLRYKETWGGQHKLIRCRSDREIAEQLAQVTNFAND